MSPLSRLASNIFELQPLEIRRLFTTAAIEGTLLHIVGTSSSESITINKNSAGKISVSGVTATFTPGTQFNSILVEAGGGNDTVLVTSNVKFTSGAGIPVTLAGNDGNDNLTGGPGNDVLSGGNGDDTLDGGVGNDQTTGGANIDTTNYSNRTGAVRVFLDNVANDGEVAIGEADNVQTEEVIGGAGNDSLNGSSLADFLAGGGGADNLIGGDGNDQLTGGSGIDKLFGQNGDDFLLAQNQDADTVSGGTNSDGTADLDLASIDTIDVGSAPGTIYGSSEVLKTPIPKPPGTGPGDLDATYGTNGKALGPDLGWTPSAAAVDSAGRIVYVGTVFESNGPSNGSVFGADLAIARFDANGNLDTTFGNNGQDRVDFTAANGTGYGYNDDDVANGVTIDSSGRILVVGSTSPTFANGSDFAFARLTSTGALDTTFSGDGLQRVDVTAIVTGGGYNAGNNGDAAQAVGVQSDGKIVAAGQFLRSDGTADIALVRLLDNGLLDSSANDATTPFTGLGANTGGGVALVGAQTSAHGNNSVGGIAFQSFAGDAGKQRIVVAGTAGTDGLLVRFNSNGTADTTFGDGTGARLDNFSVLTRYNAVTVNAANEIFVAGNGSQFVIGKPGTVTSAPALGQTEGLVVKYNANAVNDTPPNVFQSPAVAGNDTDFTAITLDAAGRVLAAGTDSGAFIVARFASADLTPDSTFGAGGTSTISFGSYDAPEAVRVLSNDKILVAGTSLQQSEAILPASARLNGTPSVPPNLESEVDGIEKFTTWGDLHAGSPPLDGYLNNLSPGSQMYQLAQPDGNGNAIITLNGNDNVVTISNVVAGDGRTNVAVNVDGIVIYYDALTTHRIGIVANAGNDSITTASNVTVPLVISGGAGNDSILGGAGKDVIFGGDGNDSLNGAGANDVISAGAGNDSVAGDVGNDLLIGGPGADNIDGGGNEDIVIAGYTNYDDNLASLDSVVAEWGSANSNAVRINNIRNGGGLNGSVVLKTGLGATVFNDSAIDNLTGGSGRDWFFARTSGTNKDKFLDNTGGEELDLI